MEAVQRRCGKCKYSSPTWRRAIVSRGARAIARAGRDIAVAFCKQTDERASEREHERDEVRRDTRACRASSTRGKQGCAPREPPIRALRGTRFSGEIRATERRPPAPRSATHHVGTRRCRVIAAGNRVDRHRRRGAGIRVWEEHDITSANMAVWRTAFSASVKALARAAEAHRTRPRNRG